MKFKAFIFDFDGTLVNSAPDLANAVNVMRTHYNLSPLDRNTIISYIGNGALKLVQRSLKETEIDCEEALEIFLECYKKDICEETCFYPGVIKFLDELLKKEIPAGILTNKPQEMTDLLLKKLSADHYFKFAFGPDKFGKKPDPTGLKECLKILDLQPEEVLMVGDHNTDIFAANALSVPSVFLSYGFGIIGESKPDYIFDSFEELFRFL